LTVIGYGSSALDFILNFKERLKSEIQFESIHISGAKGNVNIISKSTEPLPRIFVKDMALNNIQLTITDHKQRHNDRPFTFPQIAIYSYAGQFRNENMVSDILQSSTFLGSLGHGLVSVKREGDRVVFSSQNLPVGSVSKYLNEPFSWFNEATLDSDVHAFTVDGSDEYTLYFNLKLSNLVPDPSIATSNVNKMILPVLADYIKKHNAQIPLEFYLILSEGELDWKDISTQITVQLVKKVLSENAERIKENAERIKESAERIKESAERIKESAERIKENWRQRYSDWKKGVP